MNRSLYIPGHLRCLLISLNNFLHTKQIWQVLACGLINVAGIGAGLALIPALLTVELHFPRVGNKFATTVALSGIGIGVATFPPALNWLLMNADNLYCLLTLSGVLVIISAMGLFMTPPAPLENSKLTIEIFKVPHYLNK